MVEWFVDTGGWAAYLCDRDAFHSQAADTLDAAWAVGGKLITTNLVLSELTALLVRMKVSKADQIAFFDGVAVDESIQVVTIDPTREAAAWALRRSRPDKEWTHVDCASFVVMGERKLTEAVTTDHHFEQAGFVRRLK